jgi:hypothetical protein
MIRWPRLLGGSHKLVSWLNRLVKACQAAEVKEVKNGQLVRNTDGLTIICGGSRGGETTNPFEIYQTESWLKYKVKTGYVITTGNEIVPTYVETEFTITSGVLRYWFYVEVASGASTAEIKTSATTLAWDSTKIPLGWIDTQTGAGTNTAKIHQLVRDNIIVNSGGGESKRMTVLAVNGDWLLCSDGVSQYSVAKWPENRTSLASETIDGVTLTYTYTNSNTRVASDGTYSQTEVIYRRYVVGQVLFALKPANKTDLTVGSTVLEWVESCPRVWLRKYIQ